MTQIKSANIQSDQKDSSSNLQQSNYPGTERRLGGSAILG